MAAEGLEARKSIIRTFLILLGLTVFEFIIAFTKAYYPDWFGISPAASQMIVIVTFIILTIFKAEPVDVKIYCMKLFAED